MKIIKKQSFWTRWAFPKALRLTLEAYEKQPSPERAYFVTSTFVHDISFVQKFIHGSLSQFKQTSLIKSVTFLNYYYSFFRKPSQTIPLDQADDVQLFCMITHIKQKEDLIKDLEAITLPLHHAESNKKMPATPNFSLVKLYDRDLLQDKKFEFAQLFVLLHSINLFKEAHDQQLFVDVMKDDNSRFLFHILTELTKSNLLYGEGAIVNLKTVLNRHLELNHLLNLLKILNTINLLTHANFAKITQQPANFYALAIALKILHQNELINEDKGQSTFVELTNAGRINFQSGISSLDCLSSQLVQLDKASLLTGPNAAANLTKAFTVSSYPHAYRPLVVLNEIGLLTQDNFDQCVQNVKLSHINAEIIKKFKTLFINNPQKQINFDQLVAADTHNFNCIFKRFNINFKTLTIEDTQTIFNLMCSLKNPLDLESILNLLSDTTLLKPENSHSITNFIRLLTFSDLHSLKVILLKLNILEGALPAIMNVQANFEAILASKNIEVFATAISRSWEYFGYPKNFNELINHSKILIDGMGELWNTSPIFSTDLYPGLLNYAKLFARHITWGKQFLKSYIDNFRSLNYIYEMLSPTKLLGQHTGPINFRKILLKTSGEIALITPMLTKINSFELFKEDSAQIYFDKALIVSNCQFFLNGIYILNLMQLLTSNSLGAMLRLSSILFCETNGPLWSRMRPDRMTADVLQRIIAIADEHAGDVPTAQIAVMNYINMEFFQIQPQNIVALAAPIYNAYQSTHTASIHASVSRCAIKLFNFYGSEIDDDVNLEIVLKEVENSINRLPDNHLNALDSLKLTSAKKCLSRLAAKDYGYTDPVSKISTRQVIALFWLAIHDAKKIPRFC